MDSHSHINFCRILPDVILKDSLSLVKILENTKFNENCFLFTVDFESLYTNIPVLDAKEMMKKLVFLFQNVIPNAHFITELLDIVCIKIYLGVHYFVGLQICITTLYRPLFEHFQGSQVPRLDCLV